MLGRLNEIGPSSERQRLMLDLPSADATISCTAARLLVEKRLLSDDSRVGVLALDVEPRDEDEVREALELMLVEAGRRAEPLEAAFLVEPGCRSRLLLEGDPGPTSQDMQTVADRLRQEVAVRVPTSDVRVGIGSVEARPVHAHISTQHACEALASQRVFPALAPIAAWDDIEAQRLLIKLPFDERPEEAIPGGGGSSTWG